MAKRNNHKFTPEIMDYFYKHYKDTNLTSLSVIINNKFGIESNKESLSNLKSRMKRCGYIFDKIPNSGQFKKGNISNNKGKKWSEYMPKESQMHCLATAYKKGNISSNNVPIGSTRWRYWKKDQKALYIKYQDGHRNNNWKPMHLYLYEQKYGKVPKGNKLIFLDGDCTNYKLDNLAVVSDSQELMLNRRKLIFTKKELTESSINIVKYMDKAYKIRKKKK